MAMLDWLVIILFFVVMIVIGFTSYNKISGSKDFFVAGGKLPWWLSGISHHVSGYSGAVFVAYAALAYTHGFSIYIWWALTITVAVITGAYLMAPRWARLRINYDIESPTEYLSLRYNLPTQQLMAWCGVLLKLFDVGAKWAAIGILLNVFTGIPIIYGILVSGIVSLIYITIGGLWADVWTDFAQFIVQIVAGLVMFFVVMNMLGGPSSLTGIWAQLPQENSMLFREPYTVWYVFFYFFVVFLSYNGGTWNLATRYISAPSGKEAKKSGILSGVLYLIWPLFLFFPMWAAPLILPGLEDPSKLYGLLAQELLPAGLVGLVLAGLFAATMSMTSSDANTISAVITRDILPVMNKKYINMSQKESLRIARITTFTFTLITLVIGIQAESFGGVLGLIISWFGALIGPISIPMLLGLFPQFKHSDSKAAISSILAGLLMFVLTKYAFTLPLSLSVGSPVLVSGIVFIGMGLLNRNTPVKPEVEALIQAVSKDDVKA
ncbi:MULTISPECIES: sodium:solute symporter family protein [Sporosarcina]|uniref:sodium:solute symporter family protein n=1 Tax=Sporosarcina TaxID=1569 RepID=UPI00129B62B7|nr:MULTISPECIES: sodium:solute symporter family protein [Sporosarcina]GKV66577.1 sodium-coupled permease [Sporosarcina sp. NCCP-2331]GLB56854.1 sodium-coupled permease [Sporosarcina sp. NCCP-2378]